MQREIKFRGKRVDGGGWVYGDLIHGVGRKKDKMYILPLVENLAYLPGCHHLDGYEVIPETVGQFTGAKDRNGVDIYEGDQNQDTATCVWNADDCSFNWDYEEIEFTPFEHEYEWCLIIGNIHDNPQLLTK